jgi:hypothetical protein
MCALKMWGPWQLPIRMKSGEMHRRSVADGEVCRDHTRQQTKTSEQQN